jgi:hypothetical protein
MDAARPISPRDRDSFLRDVAVELAKHAPPRSRRASGNQRTSRAT